MPLNIQRGPPAEPLRILLHGVAGIGKTTWAASIPRVLFVSAEDGGGDLGFDRVQVDSWPALLSTVEALAREPHDYETVALDTIDAMERMLHAHLCTVAKCATIEEVGGGFGKGYTAALTEHTKLAAALDMLRTKRRMSVVIIAHTVVKTFKDPEGPDYDRYMLSMNDKAARMWTGWADCVLFANHDVRVQVRQGAKVGEKGKARDEVPARRLYTTPRAAFDAKNRYSLPDDLDLSWADFAKAIRWEERTAAARANIQSPPPPTAAEVQAAGVHAMRELDWLAEDVQRVLRAHGAESAKAADVPPENRAKAIAALSVPKNKNQEAA